MEVPYVYEVSFDITPDQMTQLEIGHSLERLVGYMKIRLPVQEGFVFADAWYSVDDPAKTRVIARSEWSDWTDVEKHRKSSILEDHLFEEFDPHVNKDNVTIRTYAEVGSGPFSVRK
jgi:hypothetical protein